ncbi:MAG: hypothetical protein ABI160_01445 [Mycobacteriaceae bacterium]
MATPATTGSYDEALERFHRTGPEFDGYLSNHGPMVIEALSRRGRSAVVHRWTDRYLQRLDEPPLATWAIGDDWRGALGDPTRAGDWIAFFTREVAQAPWLDVLGVWWPRLLPGIAAGAPHGVIRVGHAVRGVREVETAPRVVELAHALAYWAARWQALPIVHPTGSARASALLAAVPRVAVQTGGIRKRLTQLGDTTGWDTHAARLAAPTSAVEVPAALDAPVDATVEAYPIWAHGGPTTLVHAATAPNAVAAVLPSLPPTLWLGSFDAAWSATAAVFAAYRPAAPRPVHTDTGTPEDVLDRALAHGGEHVIKLTDTALDSHGRTRSPAALTATPTAIDLDA